MFRNSKDFEAQKSLISSVLIFTLLEKNINDYFLMIFMLELYQFEECPFCQKVRTVLSELELDYVCRNVSRNREERTMVKLISGQEAVPVLVDSDNKKVVVDSEKIIEYLRTR